MVAVRAVLLDRFGGPEVLHVVDVPDPEPGPGEVLIAAECCNITFVETQLRSGRVPYESMRPQLPAVLGNGVGGVIGTVGDGVDASWVGRRVVSGLNGRGGYADQAVTQTAKLVGVPTGMSVQDALAVLADGRTALLLLDALRPALEPALGPALDPGPGARVLVTAAAGGVGGLLVQLLRAAGAQVVGAAGGERKIRHAADLGADHVLDYSIGGWAERARADLGPVDAVLDGVGGTVGAHAVTVLRDGGVLMPYGMAGGPAPATGDAVRTMTIGAPTTEQSTAASARAIDLVANGRLRPTVGATYPLERAADAHAAIEARAVLGKTLLTVS